MHTQGADFLPATHFLKRGDVNQKEEVMTSGFLPVLSRSPEDNWRTTPSPGARTPLQRQALARWLTDVDQGAGALLARVMVNRIWALHFGRGLVATPNDFGAQGEAPSHPDLLEWLADDFVRSGWSVKHLQRLILSSSAYQQSARNELPPELASRDAGNRLLHQFPRRRLEAEAIRDSLLAVSGLLDPTSGGPGTLDENHQRRALYFQVKRSQLSRTLQLFDAPDAVLSAGNRPATITAPQALLFLNSPLVRAGATAFARRLEPIAVHDPAAAVRLGYLLTTGRPPDVTELAEATGYLSARAAAGDAASRSRALTDFCQVLFGLNEFVYVE